MLTTVHKKPFKSHADVALNAKGNDLNEDAVQYKNDTAEGVEPRQEAHGA